MTTRRTFVRALVVIGGLAWANPLGHAQTAAPAIARVRVQTELGDIVIEVDGKRAPGTVANFLRYVDAGHYDGGTFQVALATKLLGVSAPVRPRSNSGSLLSSGANQ